MPTSLKSLAVKGDLWANLPLPHWGMGKGSSRAIFPMPHFFTQPSEAEVPKPFFGTGQNTIHGGLFQIWYFYISQDVLVLLHCCLILLRDEILKSLEKFRSLASWRIKMLKLRVAKISPGFCGSHTNLNQNSTFIILQLVLASSPGSYLFAPRSKSPKY